MAKILGLDLGTNSIGWAITEQTEQGYTLLDKGVHIFQEGVNKTKSGEEPMVKTRTDKRALRRLYYRRRLRKIELLKVLIVNDLCPYVSESQLSAWRYEKQYPMNEAFLAWQRTDDNIDKNPYHDRYLCITTKLDLEKQSDRYVLGRALYHLSQRRGFLSNRKEQSKENEDGKVKSAISNLSVEMQDSGCEYLGEYFYHLYQNHTSIRRKYTSRKEHFEKEFWAICKKQHLTESLQKSLYKAIFYQRPLRSQKGLVGTCTFEKGKSRCPVSHPRFEEFRMWQFINNIRVKSYADEEYRSLSQSELEKVFPLFYRKSKSTFDFEDIAKAIAGKKKDCYAYKDDRIEAPYRFNYRMTTSVSACPVTASLRNIFGEDWLREICSLYVKAEEKTQDQILNDVWHVLFSFDDEDRLYEWAKLNLQLDDNQAKDFVKIRMPQDYASLSLNAINKMLPYLRIGYRYDEAVFLANLPNVLDAMVWNDEERRSSIINDVATIVSEFKPNPNIKNDTKENAIHNYLLDLGIDASEIKIERMYHPSMIETYQASQPNKDGLLLLGSPRTSSVRNPMAMRALFRLRALINQLIKEGKIDRYTKINIEFARGLNNANKRNAIYQVQRDNEAKHKKYAEAIKVAYKEQCGKDIEPTADDILKYQLWEEQKNKCLYTGKQIRICDFIGSGQDYSPKYDIEHTVPRSRGGDNSQMNKTLCECDFNRNIKKGKLPSELANHSNVLTVIESLGWEEKIKDLYKQIEKTRGSFSTKEIKDSMIQKRHRLTMELDYWKGKISRFKMTDVPAGFSNRQGVDIGIIGRYARMYLKTVFDKVYVVKGSTTSDFRKAWGLQSEYERKERSNHVHHCIDAITIACIDANTYQKWAEYVSVYEKYEKGYASRPVFAKPWKSFTEDVKSVADELLVAHHTTDNLPKQSRKKVRVRGKIMYNNEGNPMYAQGDTARASLHQDTFYGAIRRGDDIKFVVRKSLDSLQETDVEKIVDDAIKNCVKKAIAQQGFKEAMSKPICFNEEKEVYIKKVRIYTPSVTQPLHLKKQRDESRHDYKREYHVANDGNYCMAIYEGLDKKGKISREFEIVNNLTAASYFKQSCDRDSYPDIVPIVSKKGYPLKCLLKTGSLVLFYEKTPEQLYECTKEELVKRLYRVTVLAADGRITFVYHQDARDSKVISAECGMGLSKVDVRNPVAKLRLSMGAFNAFVQDYDFDMTVTGDIIFKRNH